jgi:hypothetical protein
VSTRTAPPQCWTTGQSLLLLAAACRLLAAAFECRCLAAGREHIASEEGTRARPIRRLALAPRGTDAPSLKHNLVTRVVFKRGDVLVAFIEDQVNRQLGLPCSTSTVEEEVSAFDGSSAVRGHGTA